MTTGHIVLAGDSIFDNDGYVPGEPGVIEQLRRSLGARGFRSWSCSKVAVDGDCIRVVAAQVVTLPTNATHLVVSVGGNDALGHSHLLSKIGVLGDLDAALHRPLSSFRTNYRDMLATLEKTDTQVHVCTIYTAVPFEEPLWRTYVPPALDQFNEVILEEAERRSISVIRLDQVCDEADDYSSLSPIEPSAKGGQKVVDAIIAAVT